VKPSRAFDAFFCCNLFMRIHRSTLPTILEHLPIDTSNPEELVQSALAMYDTQAVSSHSWMQCAMIDSQPIRRRQLKVQNSGTYGLRHMQLIFLISLGSWMIPISMRPRAFSFLNVYQYSSPSSMLLPEQWSFGANQSYDRICRTHLHRPLTLADYARVSRGMRKGRPRNGG